MTNLSDVCVTFLITGESNLSILQGASLHTAADPGGTSLTKFNPVQSLSHVPLFGGKGKQRVTFLCFFAYFTNVLFSSVQFSH